MGRIRHKRKHTSNGRHRMYRTRRYQRDIDQIQEDIMIPESKKTLLFKKIDPDLPGLGIEIFINNDILLNKQASTIVLNVQDILKQMIYW